MYSVSVDGRGLEGRGESTLLSGSSEVMLITQVEISLGLSIRLPEQPKPCSI